MSQRLTVLIPAKNERRNLRLCVESVRPIADEILVADSGSTDDTVELARSLGCRVIQREFIDFSNFKNWAIPQAAHPWVLIVDADERVTPELADETRRVLAENSSQIDAYWIYRDTYFLGHRLRYGECLNDKVMRLLRRDQCRYTNRRVHEHLGVLPGREGTLQGRLLHYTSWTYEQYLGKMIHYTGFGARDMQDRGRQAGFWSMFLRPPIRFFQLYILRRGFLDGLPGLQMSMLVAFTGFLKQARLWALDHAVPQPDPESDRPSIERARKAA
ncbi:MAG: glycosyltransferase family 2 protein [Pirellulales bacterium]|nr:glycosyltransferase family 2 protein [Pirellulales bacterium]